MTMGVVVAPWISGAGVLTVGVQAVSSKVRIREQMEAFFIIVHLGGAIFRDEVGLCAWMINHHGFPAGIIAHVPHPNLI
jgi:hypothetical protein